MKNFATLYENFLYIEIFIIQKIHFPSNQMKRTYNSYFEAEKFKD